MKWIRPCPTFVFCALAFAAVVPAAHATEPAATARSKAQSIYAEGEKAFAQGRFEDALTAFEKAYLLDPVPVLLYNIARANEELGRFGEATRYFESYLARVPDAKDRRDVETRLTVLRKAAKVSKDVEVARADAEKARAEAKAAKAAKVEAEQAQADRAKAEVEATRNTEPKSNWLAWTFIGTGGGMVLLGLASWGQAKQSVDDAQSIVDEVGGGTPTTAQSDAHQAAADRASSQGAAGWALVSLGAVAGVVGYFLYEDEPEPAVGVVPMPNGIGVVGTF